jgi:hypothetical protein
MEWTFDTVSEIAYWGILGGFIAYVWYSLASRQRESEKYSRAIDEQSRLKEESNERWNAHVAERRRVLNNLKRSILDDFDLIKHGEKRSLGPEAFDAVITLRDEQGEHPDTLNTWEPVIEKLRGEISDADAAQELLDDLLYPDALQDAEELKQRIIKGFDRAAGSSHIDPAVLEAAQALRKIEARDARKKREEREEEARELRRQKDKTKKPGNFGKRLQEITRDWLP